MITDVALSKFHTVFLTSSGRVYTCGHGQGGRLGLDTSAPVITPHPIRAFTHTIIIKVAVGPDHSLFLTDSGQVSALLLWNLLYFHKNASSEILIIYYLLLDPSLIIQVIVISFLFFV